MTDKELKKLTRAQLLEIMLEQSKEIDRLTEELDSVRKKLEGRELKISKTGSLAEASAAVNSFMETAQATADQYLENIRRICGEKAAAAGKTEEWNRVLREIEGQAEDAAGVESAAEAGEETEEAEPLTVDEVDIEEASEADASGAAEKAPEASESAGNGAE